MPVGTFLGFGNPRGFPCFRHVAGPFIITVPDHDVVIVQTARLSHLPNFKGDGFLFKALQQSIRHVGFE